MYQEVIEDVVEYAKKLLQEYLPELVDVAKDGIKETIIKVQKGLMPTIEGFVRGMRKSKSVSSVEVDILTMQKMIQIAQQNIVSGANGFAALKLQKDSKYFVYLANCKDRALLDESVQKYAVIKANEINAEVNELFGENDLIILN